MALLNHDSAVPLTPPGHVSVLSLTAPGHDSLVSMTPLIHDSLVSQTTPSHDARLYTKFIFSDYSLSRTPLSHDQPVLINDTAKTGLSGVFRDLNGDFLSCAKIFYGVNHWPRRSLMKK
jgi:hypothetical protein